MAKVRIYQKTAGIPVNTSVFAVEILQNNIWYTRKVSWETIKGLIAGAESLVLENGILTFTTPDGIEHPVLSVDSEVTPNSSNPVSGGAVNAALAGKQNTLTFDQVPTDGSTNPVESNGIFDALAGKQDALTFDSTPTDGSTNPVTSQGIYAAISAAISGIDWKQAVATYADIATTYPNPEDGWTVTTLDDDHTYRFNGTEWVDQFSLITLATATKDGLMSSGNFSKLEGIEAQANKTVVFDTLTPSTTTKKLATVSGGGSSKDILGDDAEAVVEELYTDETVTGNPLTFKSITGGKATACKVTMNPIQDLHGYEFPWAGGAGKNKVNIADRSGITTQTIIGRPTLKAGTYTLSAMCANSGTAGIALRITNITDSPTSRPYVTTETFTKTILTFTLDEEQEIVINVIGSASGYNGSVKEIQIEQGSTATEYAPYSNICPISGRDSANVSRTADEDVETHTHTYASPVYGGTDDFVSGEGSETNGIADLGSITWTKQEAGGRWYFFTYVSNLTNCKTYSSPRTQPLMCSQYRNFHNGEPYADLPECAIYNAAINNTPIIAIIDTRYSSASDFQTAMSGVQLCYELATPTDITNDPEDVTLLKGENIISTDADNIELTAAKIQEATGGGAGGVDYSTAEQNTGIKWIDGNDVYQKTFVNSNLQYDYNYQGAFLLGQMPSGYDRIIGYEGIAEGTTAAVRQFVGLNGTNDVNGWSCGFHITDGAILIYPAQGTPSQMSSLEGGWAAVTIRYTKS